MLKMASRKTSLKWWFKTTYGSAHCIPENPNDHQQGRVQEITGLQEERKKNPWSILAKNKQKETHDLKGKED